MACESITRNEGKLNNNDTNGAQIASHIHVDRHYILKFECSLFITDYSSHTRRTKQLRMLVRARITVIERRLYNLDSKQTLYFILVATVTKALFTGHDDTSLP